MSEKLREGGTPYQEARCGLAGCGEILHIVHTTDRVVYLEDTAAELGDVSGFNTSTWRVECEAGHVILVPPDTAADYYEFGKCVCAGGLVTDENCTHDDLARLRRVLQAPA